MPIRTLLALGALAALVFAAPPAVQAQGIAGTVRHAQTAEPLPGVLVSALDYRGERVRGTLTDATGRFVLEVPMGRYSLRAERIGLRTEVTDTFDVRTLDLHFVAVRMVERAVQIRGLVVDSRVQSCRIDAEQAVRIQRWWQDIRTALSVSAVVQGQSDATFEVERYEREWDEDVRSVIATNSRVETRTNSRPFVSQDAALLDSAGFVQGVVAGQRQYYAPDAEVLLSSVFLTGHCFSLATDRDRVDQLGLRFEPVRDRTISDVEGTLWVDTTTAELQGLEFAYVNVEDLEDTEAGGTVLFDYLPSGAWIVSDWHIRMPKLAQEGRDPTDLEVVGYVDVGGRARPRRVAPGDWEHATFGTIRGTVHDSLRARALPDATVAILGTRFRTTTDSTGAFVLTNVPTGTHRVTFYHADTEAWGLGNAFAEVEVREGLASEVRLAVPAFRRAALSLCLGEGVGAQTVLVGRVRGPDREPLENVPLEVSWTIEREEEEPEPWSTTAATGAGGRFVLCTLPPGIPVTVRARVGADRVETFEVTLAPEEVAYREVSVAR